MPEAIRRVIERLPLQFRLLYRQFLLRVIDLESLSIEADIPRFLGQFAGVLIMISMFQTFGFVIVSGGGADLQSMLRMGLHTVQSLLAGTMLVAGLTAVATWDNIFPDLRDGAWAATGAAGHDSGGKTGILCIATRDRRSLAELRN